MSGYKASVLIAEDGALERRILKSTLQPEGYRISVVADGRTALEAYQQHGADVILLDWMMPGMDGLTALREIRSIATPVPPYILMLTGRIDRDDLVTALTAGADDYLTKPFDRRELLVRIRTGARTHQLMRELWRNNDLLRRLAMTDPLTELPNRRAFDEWLTGDRCWPDSARSLAVIVLDLDSFKQINDTHGHDAGDQALREAALRIKATVRTADIVARYGGDEFVVGMPDCSREDAERVARRVQEQFSRSPVQLTGARTIELSVSTGVASYPEDAPPERLLVIADQRLYDSRTRLLHPVRTARSTAGRALRSA